MSKMKKQKLKTTGEIVYIFADNVHRTRTGQYFLELFPDKRRKYKSVKFDGFPTELECPSCHTNWGGNASECVSIRDKGVCQACDHYYRGLSSHVIANRCATIERIEELLEVGLPFSDLSRNELGVIFVAYQEMKKYVAARF